ncbi:phosphatase PAP2 family protein, partial [Epibacterium sp. MM17-32]|uniref:phosphatase PAP2 family protein n=1 Tax=Epibacterium sp. MM17-32 TaxID=2917734 RepID=UPI001EF68BE5
VLGLLSFACHLVVLLKTGYSYPKRWTTSVGAPHRDGIVSSQIEHITPPRPASAGNPEALKRLTPEQQAAIYMSVLAPTIDVTSEAGASECVSATVWRRSGATGNGGGLKYTEMLRMKAPAIDQLVQQLNYVAGYAQIRGDRTAEILTQLSLPFPFFQSIGYIDPARTPRTLELLGLAAAFAFSTIQRLKFALAVKRPIEFSPQVQPIIPTPTHASLPSGHATEAFLIARLIWKLMRQSEAPQYGDHAYWGDMLMRQAARIAINRTVAGVHFPVDSAAGAMLGLVLAEHMQNVTRGGSWESAGFDGPGFEGRLDFDWHALYEPATDRLHRKVVTDGCRWGTSKAHKGARDTPSDLLNWLWEAAVAEWRDLPPSSTVAG